MFAEKIVYKSVCILLHIRGVGRAMVFTVNPTVQFSNLADFYVYLTLITLSKINL